MSDTISRQAAIEALMSLTIYKSKREIVQAADKDENSWIGGVTECIDEIEDLPSAQPERKTGQLKYESAYNWFRCNVCRKIYPSEFMQYFDSCQYQPGFNFCPNCGADMRGERDG